MQSSRRRFAERWKEAEKKLDYKYKSRVVVARCENGHEIYDDVVKVDSENWIYPQSDGSLITNSKDAFELGRRINRSKSVRRYVSDVLNPDHSQDELVEFIDSKEAYEELVRKSEAENEGSESMKVVQTVRTDGSVVSETENTNEETRCAEARKFETDKDELVEINESLKSGRSSKMPSEAKFEERELRCYVNLVVFKALDDFLCRMDVKGLEWALYRYHLYCGNKKGFIFWPDEQEKLWHLRQRFRKRIGEAEFYWC
ncbi:MAG: hypothetical protein JRN20_13575 [Nitrososphaerota archaeon]|nr:hypothetical protein [Nitrososphaerota archaeon]MDG6923148.1 hypothetical protein [Nitrososphaerota archaeon]